MVFESVLKKIASKLDRLKIPYMLIGGQAVLAYGEPRFTKDIDITLGAGIEQVEKILDAMTRIGFAPSRENPVGFAKKTMVLPVVDQETSVPVDFIFSFSPYEAKAIERAKKIAFGKIRVRVAALEDLVIHKIFAGRPRDLEDVRILLIKNPDYDSEYIRGWLQQFDQDLNPGCLRSFEEIVKSL